mmetsp:Transcript_109994/g.350283  ORF Transcript_109994/g.350283 Transcript_109994/m.350283 type:complete len:649 (-) Transcript_109994:126-2072(-)
MVAMGSQPAALGLPTSLARLGPSAAPLGLRAPLSLRPASLPLSVAAATSTAPERGEEWRGAPASGAGAGRAASACLAGSLCVSSLGLALRQRQLGRQPRRPQAAMRGVGRNASAAGASLEAGAAAGDEDAVDNWIEEWLLGQDLPQPLKPILGSNAWAGFTAALAQMFLIGALGALGTFLEQGGPPEFYAQKYPEWSGIILILGFDKMYASPIFYGLQAWLAISIVACTATTQLPLAKRAQRLLPLTSSSLRRKGSFLVKVDCCPALSALSEQAAEAAAVAAAEAQAAGETAQRLLQLKGALEKRGFVVRSDDDASPTKLAAQRGLVGKFAPMIVHLSLLLILMGGAAGLIFGSSSEVIIPDGDTANMGKVLDLGRRNKGPLYEMFNPVKGFIDTTQVRCEDFRIKYRGDTGEVEQYYSKLVIENIKTKEKLAADEIYVNKPLRYGGATIYQADWSLDRLQLFIKNVPVVVPLKLVPDESGLRLWAAFLPLELLQAEDPGSVKTISKPDVGVVLVAENMRNVQVFGSDKKLQGILRSPLASATAVTDKLPDTPVQFGETVTVDGSELRLDRVLGATGLIIKNDPGVPLVYLGFALLMPATLLSVLPFGQVWAAVSEDKKGQLLISGRTNRNQPAFEDEMKAAVITGLA